MTATRIWRCTARSELVPSTHTDNRHSTTDWTPTRQARYAKSLDQPTFTRHASNPSSITATTRPFDTLFKLLIGHWDWKVKNCFIPFADHILLLQIWLHISIGLNRVSSSPVQCAKPMSRHVKIWSLSYSILKKGKNPAFYILVYQTITQGIDRIDKWLLNESIIMVMIIVDTCYCFIDVPTLYRHNNLPRM